MADSQPAQPVLTALLVDYGGVLTTALSECMAAWCEADGVDPTAFTAVLRDWRSKDGPTDNPVHALEIGALPAQEFERELSARLRTAEGRPPPPEGLLHRMFAGSGPDDAMVEVLRSARAAGLRTGLVSNSWGTPYPRAGWGELFDTVVISGEVGLRKPDPRIYRLAASQLGVLPAHCVFVDDLAPNVRGAAAVGMVGIHHVDAATTRAELAALFDVPF